MIALQAIVTAAQTSHPPGGTPTPGYVWIPSTDSPKGTVPGHWERAKAGVAEDKQIADTVAAIKSGGTTGGISDHRGATPDDKANPGPAPTKLDQSIIEDLDKLRAIVHKLGGTDEEATALYTTPGTWSNVDLTPAEAILARNDKLTPTEFAVRKALDALRAARAGKGTPGDITIINPPAVTPPAPTTTTPPKPLPINTTSSTSKTIAIVALVGGLVYILIAK